jgi:hypothetical protein
MRIKRNGAGAVYLAKKIARAGVGAALLLSFLVSFVPLATSAAPEAGAMTCCAGKQGHCNSGVALRRRVRPAPEPMCGLRSSKSDELTDAALAESEIAGDGITVVATPSEATTAADSSETESSSKTSAKTSHTPALRASLARPCPVDCCASTTGIVRKPRPRELALRNSGGHSVRPQIHFIRVAITSVAPASAYLLRLLPRGPPSVTC